MKKAAVAALCAVLFLGVLSACSEAAVESEQSRAENASTQTTTVSETTSETTTEPKVMQDLLIYKLVSQDQHDVLVTEPFSVPNSDSLEEKLQAIADKISVDRFDGLKIKIVKIDGEAAYVDLQDDPATSAYTGWIQQFQGSARAADTAYTLFENFFQRQLSSDWIRAVQLLHNGELMEEMDHFRNVDLVEIDHDFSGFLHTLESQETAAR